MKLFQYFLICTLLIFCCLDNSLAGEDLNIQSVKTLIGQAQQSYAQGNFDDSRKQYEKAIVAMSKLEKVNGHLFYNLGNVYYRLENYGMSMLNYRRAQLLLANDRDLLANIEKLQNKLGLEDNSLRTKTIIDSVFFWLPYSSPKVLWWVFVVAHVVLFLLITWYIWVPRKSLRIVIVSIGAIFIFSSVSLIIKTIRLSEDMAVVTDGTLGLRSGRGEDFVTIVEVPLGDRLIVLEKHEKWWKVATLGSNSYKGWAPAKQLSAIGNDKILFAKQLDDLFATGFTVVDRQLPDA